jgi:prepilin-type N-terminal cleavage/methylation domain-containing protein
MNRRRRLSVFTCFRPALNSEQGLNLIEVLIALAILAVVAVGFLAAMSTSSKAVIVGQEQVSAESLAKSQMEFIKQQSYREDQQYTKLDQIPAGYHIDIGVQALDPRQEHTGEDEGLQKITVTITRDGKNVFTLEGYKCYTGY